MSLQQIRILPRQGYCRGELLTFHLGQDNVSDSCVHGNIWTLKSHLSNKGCTPSIYEIQCILSRFILNIFIQNWRSLEQPYLLILDVQSAPSHALTTCEVWGLKRNLPPRFGIHRSWTESRFKVARHPTEAGECGLSENAAGEWPRRSRLPCSQLPGAEEAWSAVCSFYSMCSDLDHSRFMAT